VAVIDNKRQDDPYPFKELCGAGMAFKLVQALLNTQFWGETLRKYYNISDGWEKWLLDMAGLATIADMVPLVGENRILAYFGLKVLRKSRRPGLQQLFKAMKVSQAVVTEDDVGFMLAPRINAASRLSDPSEAFRMLSSGDVLESGALADELHKLNDRRKGMVAAMVRSANARLEERSSTVGLRDIVVIGDISWSPGLLGLAANTLMERYERPFFVWGRVGSSTIKGSCRSDGSVNVVELMSAVEGDDFLGFGGHQHSGGFSTNAERIHHLEEALNSALMRVERSVSQDKGEKVVDARMGLEDVTWETYTQIAALAPFGVGNPKPLFLFGNITIAGVKRFGRDGAHLELVLSDYKGTLVRAIEFFSQNNENRPVLEVGRGINLVSTFEASYYRSTPELRLRVVDIF
jgi:single-stranded-DNA-specific exonuclease